ncbi:DUF6625 family protein [Blautia sp. Sow4_E7]|uniref:DUF6625 family protein n=1 Tax=Blautia sp. Sow4_E7 TaxID=3438749 RepID=UPI003F91FE44
MNKIAFIIPYFGKFNNYFQLFLKSCKMNPTVTWLIFTDDKTDYQYPPNVKVVYTEFKTIQQRIRNKFDFAVSIERPYKLCDYRPTYGYIFEDYLKDFDYWGYCDCDLIWGNIRKYICDDILEGYDKIGVYGHCAIFKNTYEINRLFMSSLNGELIYKEVLADVRNHSFDEEYNNSINNIFITNGLRVFEGLKIANIYMKSSFFRLVNMNSEHKYEVESRVRGFFVWNDGNLERYYVDNGKINKEEFLYIHMQSRKMKNKVNEERFKIIPNSFENIEKYPIVDDDFYKIKTYHFNTHYWKLRSRNLVIKCKRFMENREN